ncbi:glycosyltransferase family 4 protein [Belliella kenyensis]|uniref:Glycosyltransferase family 4 protein n=1 Tax=Belliella kenyensis TaxID=1472724 RepID=A0ABV8EKX5_9BACT|nr:glycosyltransferase family 4 protein [Belliella kenyensis]MCH7400305.1 glycosyltransferase family 4 protein [Belliella kenyensis]MDN3604677.1 glycosyltransferase family 4 protein [Belliella kenyensis]
MNIKSSKKVLIITYYWPPSAGSGVQRWLKFAKYLPEFGWEPVIFTPENPDFDLKDEGLGKEISKEMEVIKFPIWEPYGIFRSLKKEKLADTSKVLEKKHKSLIDQAAIWLRANLLVPDPRIFWVRPSVNFLADIIQNNQIDAIITTGPPHSLHLIGRNLKRKLDIPWLADFRDPWSQWEFLDTLPMSKLVRNYHVKLEESVLQEADAITTISPTFKADLEHSGSRLVHLLTNGFDPADLPPDWQMDNQKKDNSLEIVYTGVIDAIRNPIPFLQAYQASFQDKPINVMLRFVGKVSSTVIDYVNQNEWLKANVSFEGYVSHEKVFDYYRDADILLLILTDTKNAKGNIPGKLFEYIATGRRVIALGDKGGDSAKILRSAQAGEVFAHHDLEGITSYLKDFDQNSRSKNSASTSQYSRKKLTQHLANILDDIKDPVS